MQKRKLGKSGLEVSAIGLGAGMDAHGWIEHAIQFWENH